MVHMTHLVIMGMCCVSRVGCNCAHAPVCLDVRIAAAVLTMAAVHAIAAVRTYTYAGHVLRSMQWL